MFESFVMECNVKIIHQEKSAVLFNIALITVSALLSL